MTKEIDEVYHDRNLLACLLVQVSQRPSGYRVDPENDDWGIVWVYAPNGEISWHVPMDMIQTFDIRENEGLYDGYDREEKNERLLDWAIWPDGVKKE